MSRKSQVVGNGGKVQVHLVVKQRMAQDKIKGCLCETAHFDPVWSLCTISVLYCTEIQEEYFVFLYVRTNTSRNYNKSITVSLLHREKRHIILWTMWNTLIDEAKLKFNQETLHLYLSSSPPLSLHHTQLLVGVFLFFSLSISFRHSLCDPIISQLSFSKSASLSLCLCQLSVQCCVIQPSTTLFHHLLLDRRCMSLLLYSLALRKNLLI